MKCEGLEGADDGVCVTDYSNVLRVAEEDGGSGIGHNKFYEMAPLSKFITEKRVGLGQMRNSSVNSKVVLSP